MCDVAAAVMRFTAALPANTPCALAVSGGIDSMVLLHAFAASKIHFSVYHVNHQLSPHADDWASHVQKQCTALSLPFTLLTVQSAPEPGDSIEAWARDARYAALTAALPTHSILITAHHQHDQAETVLLQLMRGAGPKGLSGMALVKKLCHQKQIALHRPLLHVAKEAIEAYAKQHQLTWVEDESNTYDRFDRNFMRHQALPLLKTRSPHIVESLAQSAAHCQEQQAVMDACLSAFMPSLAGKEPGTLSAEKLVQHEHVVVKALLRYWLELHHVRMPSPKKLASIIDTVLKSAPSAHPQITIDNHVVLRYQDTVYVLPAEQLVSLSGHEYVWDPREPLCLPFNAGTLCADDLQRAGILVPAGETVTVRFRAGGDVVFVPGVGHQPLKKWFQSRDIPPWRRERIPLIMCSEGGWGVSLVPVFTDAARGSIFGT